MNIKRLNHELPMATGEWGWRYHHLGIPTNETINDAQYLSQFKLYVGGFDSSPYGIEWMRFETDSPVDDLIKTDFKILTKPNSPGDGIRVAMIEHNGAPIELIEFEKTNDNN